MKPLLIKLYPVSSSSRLLCSNILLSALFSNTLSSRPVRVFHPDPARKLSTNLYDIYHCCVYSKKTPDDGHRNCPKHVEFHSKNKFDKQVHLICFIIRKFIMMHGHVNVRNNNISDSIIKKKAQVVTYINHELSRSVTS